MYMAPQQTETQTQPKTTKKSKPREATEGGDAGSTITTNSSTTTGPSPSAAATWRGGGAAGGAMAAAMAPPVLYRFDRVEAQIRLLGDTCLVMQDYETALATYKLVRVRWCGV